MDRSTDLINEKRLTKNVVYNLIGYGIPLIFAIVFIPFLIKGLGDEKFGILNLAWIVIGYFSFLDLGIGRTLTKIIAERIGTNQVEEIPQLFWTSILLLFAVSLFFTMVLVFLTPTLVYDVFKISKNLHSETLNSFYVLALSVPIVTTTAGIRGVLEAYQKFGIINVIRILLGVLTFLVPMLCLIFTNSLFWIVVLLLLVRILIWILYAKQCYKLNICLKREIVFDKKLVIPILKFSGWITASNIIVPIIVYMDRFIVGAVVSAEAITYYATPYEVVSKLLIIPGAVTGVLFPAFSTIYPDKPKLTKKLASASIKYIFTFLFPIVLIIIVFASEGLNLWLGEKFSDKSTLVLQLFAAGILFNSIAYIPFSFLQGIGKPEIVTKVQFAEFPIYLTLLWFLALKYGVNGAAIVWFLRMVIDAGILLLICEKYIPSKFEFNFNTNYLWILLVLVCSIIPLFIDFLIIKIIIVFIIIIFFSIISWNFFLNTEEKDFLISKLRKFMRLA